MALNSLTSSPSLLAEWLTKLATATSPVGVRECLTHVLQTARQNPRFYLTWNGTTHPEPVQFTLSDEQQQLLAQGQSVIYQQQQHLWTMLPLIHGTLRGWLALPDPRDSDVMLLPIAFQTAARLHTLETRSQTRVQLRELELFNELGRALSGSLELDPILAALHHVLTQMLGPHHLAVALYDQDSGQFRLATPVQPDQDQPVLQQWTAAQGLTGYVVRQGTTLVTDDYDRTCRELNIEPLIVPGFAPAYAWIGVPLHQSDRSLGVLTLFADDPQFRFAPEQVHMVELVAAQAAVAFEQARLFERTVHQARQLALLNELGRTLTSTLDLEAVPSLIMGRVQQIMDVEEGSLLLLDEDTNELIFSYSLSPYGRNLLGKRLPPHAGIAGLVMRTGQSLIANGAHEHPAFYTGIDEITGHYTRDLLCVPLLGRRGVQGVIEVINHREHKPFTVADRMLLEAVADQAVIAVENANLYTRTDRALVRRVRELDERNKQLREILRISHALRVTSDLADVLPGVAQAISTSIGFNTVIVSLVQTPLGRPAVLRPVAAAGLNEQALADWRALVARPADLDDLLRPPYQRGAMTYFVDHPADANRRIWGIQREPQDFPELRSGVWHPHDALFAVLRASGGELLGLLMLDEPLDGMQPTPEQIQSLEIFANQLVVALENARLYDQLRQNLQGMTALSSLGMAINSALNDPQAIWQWTVGGILDATGALGAGVLMCNDQPNSYDLVLALGRPHQPDDKLLQLADQVCERGKPFQIIASRGELPPTIDAAGGKALLMLPLRGTYETLGTLYVWYSELLPSSEEQDLVTLFAGQAAVAVENMRLAAAVREGRDRFASILASTEEAIVLFDANLMLIEANSAFQQIVGGDRATLIKQSGAAIVAHWQMAWSAPDEQWHHLRTALEDVSAGHAAEARGQLALSGPRSRWFAWTALPVHSDTPQSPHPLILVIRDITAAMELERFRQDLTYMMIHDMRGPLASVMTSLDLLGRSINTANPTHINVLRIATNSSRRLLDMVNTLLDISKLEAGQMVLHRDVVDLDTLLQPIVQSYAPMLAERSVEIDLSRIDDAPAVMVDQATIERVLQNLIDNALKYSPPESFISLAAHPANRLPADHPEGDWLMLRVRDQGPGIPPEYHERVFEKFSQVKASSVKGTGLGLTYCRLAVEAHGGRIWVADDANGGAEFVLTLPLAALS